VWHLQLSTDHYFCRLFSQQRRIWRLMRGIDLRSIVANRTCMPLRWVCLLRTSFLGYTVRAFHIRSFILISFHQLVRVSPVHRFGEEICRHPYFKTANGYAITVSSFIIDI
jgi:hypothetical protein